MIYRYEDTLTRIYDFLDVGSVDHIHFKEKFKPEVSINNTQLFKRLNNVENEVKIIEKELPNYLFEFPDGMALENANNYF